MNPNLVTNETLSALLVVAFALGMLTAFIAAGRRAQQKETARRNEYPKFYHCKECGTDHALSYDGAWHAVAEEGGTHVTARTTLQGKIESTTRALEETTKLAKALAKAAAFDYAPLTPEMFTGMVERIIKDRWRVGVPHIVQSYYLNQPKARLDEVVKWVETHPLFPIAATKHSQCVRQWAAAIVEPMGITYKTPKSETPLNEASATDKPGTAPLCPYCAHRTTWGRYMAICQNPDCDYGSLRINSTDIRADKSLPMPRTAAEVLIAKHADMAERCPHCRQTLHMGMCENELCSGLPKP